MAWVLQGIDTARSQPYSSLANIFIAIASILFAREGVPGTQECCRESEGAGVPVRMFWKASSTLLASKADVSMKDRLFSPSVRGVSAVYLQ